MYRTIMVNTLNFRIHPCFSEVGLMDSDCTALRKLAHAIYRDCFSAVKIENFICQNKFDIFNNFAQNIDCGYWLEPPRRGGSNEYPQSLCLTFLSKIRKIGIPLHTPVLLYKSGVQGGIHFTDMFS